jgi:hypothetical protein
MRAATTGVLASSALILILGGVRAAQGPGTRPEPRNDPAEQHKILARAMAKKLQPTHELITSLALEDFDRLADNARTLKQIGEDTLSKVSPNVTYIKYAAEFVSLAEELARRAKAQDLNGATVSYVRLTINCVECHKHVRDNRIFDPKLQGR